ncbi:dynamin family protein [Heliorestis convoluta]|uniref:Dynamin family protein n=1 Tax=Heliorestis convoluta TaxID=356322 RepID=A0A5Q2N558_9FIRM|nr:dynamin family protein [Heliorestis convoluta]QGG49441.1 dynamin family protein [Heliorestis convoluta]
MTYDPSDKRFTQSKEKPFDQVTLRDSSSASLQDLHSRLIDVMEPLRQVGDESSICAIKGLLQKLQKEEIHIAFCGHISSGKSALLNKLLGYNWLPTSPIPTSSNIVTIHWGEPSATIQVPIDEEKRDLDCLYPESSRIKLHPKEDLTLIHQYCLDNKKAESISLTVPHQLDAPGLVFIDTPGIDSAEKAKKLAHEPAIVTADVVVYVMDYNHVQSEINFTFAKEMQEQGKILLLVIHQIDKHCDFELDFSYYKSSSRSGFAAWDVHPEGIFYTTLLDDNHEENQLDLLRESLLSLSKNKLALLPTTMHNAAKQIVKDHCARQATQHESLKQKWQEQIDETEDLEQALESYKTLQAQADRLYSRTEGLQAELEREILQVVENARITPFTTTQLAQEYLISRQPGFKVGFFFTAEKTKKEIERRLQALTDDFTHHVSTQLEWHLRSLLAKIPEDYGISDRSYMEDAHGFTVTWDSNLIEHAVKESALVNNEYTHNFTKDIASEVKRLYRREALALAEKVSNITRQESEQELTQLNERLQPLQTLVEALRNLEKTEQEERQYQTELIHLLEKNFSSTLSLQEILPSLHEHNQNDFLERSVPLGQAIGTSVQGNGSAIVTNGALSQQKMEVTSRKDTCPDNKRIEKQSQSDNLLQQTGATLHIFAQTVEKIPGFSHMAESLQQRAERLEENIFTVALFGAFSAGKSSVANALLGQFVLPVSPNPTTAAINKILPPNSIYPHGTVRVQLKTKADIESDVIHSLRACDVEAKTLDEALELLHQLSPSQIHPTAKPHYSFLQAVSKGLSFVENQLGSIQVIDLTSFNDYVASEEKACFVEWIELYYSCPLTDQGIMLVDTPGADSINARHTGVAFDYIKNADAVLFVTYFNSAFSHADRDFLVQLGRVKDTFALDKMFFLVNAADLAKTGQELEEVLEHVTERVADCGIYHPRIFPISSQTALLARLASTGTLTEGLEKTYHQRLKALRSAKNILSDSENQASCQEGLALSGFSTFEESFFHFTFHELTAVAIEAAENELTRCLTSLDEVIATAHTDAKAKRVKKAAYEASRAQVQRLIQGIDTTTERALLQQELEELLYYVKQRFFFRFGDLFNRYFNPALLQDDRGAITKNRAHHSLESLIERAEQELAQELRATSLRLESFLNGRAKQLHNKFSELVRQEVPQLQLPPREVFTVSTPELPLYRLRESTKSLFSHLSMIKSPKDFFEGSGRARLREELEKALQAPADSYLQEGRDLLFPVYHNALTTAFDTTTTEALQALNDHFESLAAALEANFNVREVEVARRALEQHKN